MERLSLVGNLLRLKYLNFLMYDHQDLIREVEYRLFGSDNLFQV
ncbi:hypothetical protein [Chryseobacterium sp.]